MTITELRKLSRWVCWCYEDRGGSKPTKIPKNPHTGGMASSTDPSTWATYAEALATCERHGYAGIGFVLGDGFAGIDLDDCIVDGDVMPEAIDVLNRIEPTYVEVSPSGNGLKAFVRFDGDLDPDYKQTTNPGTDYPFGIEVYASGRYFTVTGNAIDAAPDKLAHVDLAAFQRDVMPAKAIAPPPPAEAVRRATDATDGDTRERRCVAYVAKLPPATSGQGGHPATYRVACECVRFGLDRAAAWRVMRAYNARCLPPWSDAELRHKIESAYRDAAHEHGQRLVDRSNDPPAPSGFTGGGTTTITTTAVAAPGRRFPLTNAGNGERFAHLFGDRVKYVAAWGKWLVWTGSRWAEDVRGQVDQFAKATARAVMHDLDHEDDADRRGKIAKHSTGSEHASRLRAMLDRAKSEPTIAATPDAFDTDTMLLNTITGTVDLRTGTLRDHDPADMITKLAPVEYSAEATAPRFDQFLDEVTLGRADLREYLLRMLGYCLSGDVRLHVMPIFHGSGRNGKSTLLDLVLHAMGDYACVAPDSLLMQKSGDEHPCEVAALCGKRLAVASETEAGKSLRVTMVKRLTGDEKMSGRFMRQDYFSFDRTFKLLMVTNNRPRVAEETHAVWARLKLVPFDLRVTEDCIDTSLLDRLKDESPGVLRMLVEACGRLIRDDFDLREPDAVRKATTGYRTAEDIVGGFYADCITVDAADAFATRKAVREALERYAEDDGRPITEADVRRLYDRIRDTPGARSGKRSGDRGWHGIELDQSWTDSTEGAGE